jgi:uncharacterized membrane protein YeiB
MQSEARSILADLKAKRDVRGSESRYTNYWRTYSLIIVYGIGLALFNVNISTRGGALLIYGALAIVITTAVSDSQRAINRRFELLMELLERKGVV